MGSFGYWSRALHSRSDDRGAGDRVSEQLQVADSRGARAGLERARGGPELRGHAFGRDAAPDELFDLVHGDGRLDRPPDPHARDIGDEEQLRRLQGPRQRSRGVVGIHVVRQAAVRARSQRGDNGGEPGVEEAQDERDPHGGDLAHVAQAARRGTRGQQASVHAGQADRVDSRATERRDHEPVGGPRQDHLHDLRHLRRADRTRCRPTLRRERGASGRGLVLIQHASPAVSASPNITFMFWIAWPAAPFTRLSIAAITVSRGRRTLATHATPIATRFRYTTSLSDGSVPWVTETHGSPSYAAW